MAAPQGRGTSCLMQTDQDKLPEESQEAPLGGCNAMERAAADRGKRLKRVRSHLTTLFRIRQRKKTGRSRFETTIRHGRCPARVERIAREILLKSPTLFPLLPVEQKGKRMLHDFRIMRLR